ncbi:MAG: GerMN domain-containing protein [Desulfobacterales bacterium]|nr:GerMN domain-containing protein [Desulfobacterales bacterium]
MISNLSKYIGRLSLGGLCAVLLLVPALVCCVSGNGLCQSGHGTASQGIGRILPEPGNSEYPVYLYFVDKTNSYLVSEARNIRAMENTRAYCRRIIKELIDGPAADLTRTIPESAKLRAVYVTPDRIAYVDMTGAVSNDHPGGVRTELMTVYSIVNTLVLNVSAVDRVKLLVDGEGGDTLAGHIDIRYPLKADMLLVR